MILVTLNKDIRVIFEISNYLRTFNGYKSGPMKGWVGVVAPIGFSNTAF